MKEKLDPTYKVMAYFMKYEMTVYRLVTEEQKKQIISDFSEHIKEWFPGAYEEGMEDSTFVSAFLAGRMSKGE
jgi:hypothetical protein